MKILLTNATTMTIRAKKVLTYRGIKIAVHSKLGNPGEFTASDYRSGLAVAHGNTIADAITAVKALIREKGVARYKEVSKTKKVLNK